MNQDNLIRKTAAFILKNGWFDTSANRAENGCAADIDAILRATQLPIMGLRRRVYDEIRSQAAVRRQRGVDDPAVVLAERLEDRRKTAVRAAVGNSLRYDKIRIELTEDPTKVGARYETYDLGRYSSRCTFHKYEYTLVVTVPQRWRKRVASNGLSIANGMFTLDAARLMPAGDVELFAATWVEQSRGYSVRIVQGYIARVANVCYHGSSLRQVSQGIKRKVAYLNNPDARLAAKIQTVENLSKGLNTEMIRVSVVDAYRIGACDYGVRAWCHRVGLDYNAGSAPYSDVLAAYKSYPLPEVTATLLSVLRAAKRERLAV